MTVRETSAVAIKFLGLWFILNIVIFMPSLAFQAVSIEHFTGERVDRLSIWLFIAIYFIIGLIACYVLFRISNSILKSSPDAGGDTESKTSERFLVQLVGAYFFVSAASNLPEFILPLVSGNHSSAKELWYLPGTFLELAIGLWLLVGSSVWANWLRILRGRT